MRKRKIDIAVISDVHLGHPNCHADEILAYLNSIKPKKLILNGDIIDLNNSGAHYFPPVHMKVLKKIIGMATGHTEVIYIIGDHDAIFKRAQEFHIGNIRLVNKLVLDVDGKRAWFFHGNILNLPIQFTHWITNFGSFGYKALILINGFRNNIRERLGREKYSMTQKSRKGPDGAESFVQYFEKTATEIAVRKGYDYVVCAHISKPKKEIYESRSGKCMYLNSGDWLENLTALEYSFKRWKIYRYHKDKLSAFFADDDLKDMDISELISSIIDLKAKNKSKTEKDGESIED